MKLLRPLRDVTVRVRGENIPRSRPRKGPLLISSAGLGSRTALISALIWHDSGPT